MKYRTIKSENITLDELAECIINMDDIKLQLDVVGKEFNYLFRSLDEAKKKDMILSSLSQMPEEVIINIINNIKSR